VGKAAGLSAVSSPYFLSYSITHGDEQFGSFACGAIAKKAQESVQAPKIMSFTDTFDEVNGVALTLKQQLKAAQKHGLDYSVLSCSAGQASGVYNEVRFKPVLSHAIPQYPELTAAIPPFLQILDYCYKNNPTHIIAETEGLMGISAIAAAKILNKPVYSVYHTQFPQLVGALTGKAGFEEITWKYIKFFHQMTHTTYAPSKWIKDDLTSHGMDDEHIVVYPRGIDLSNFKVMDKTSDYNPDKTRFIYVGRLSKEKGLEVLGQAYNGLYAGNQGVELDIVGDGPYREDLQASLGATNARFHGYLKGEKLIQAYNNADVFVFPSAADTWGNVVLEAQACGLPVIVTDKGGPQENLIPDKTGLVCKADNPQSLQENMESMIDKGKVRAFSSGALAYAKGRSFEEAFLDFWDMLKQNPGPAAKPSQPNILEKFGMLQRTR